MTQVSEKIMEALSVLEPEGSPEVKLIKLVERELLRRLNHYQYLDRHMQKKYGMSFSQFRDMRVVEQKGYSFEVESDFWEWEMAQDGIQTIEMKLKELRQKTDADQ